MRVTCHVTPDHPPCVDCPDAPCVVDLSVECAHCGEPLREPAQRESGFCKPACRRAFLDDAETLTAAIIAEVTP